MAADGNWNITMSTPMGDRDATLSLKSAGGALTGTQAAEGNSIEIFDGRAGGHDPQPMPDSPAKGNLGLGAVTK